jgi:hypothetical protein
VGAIVSSWTGLGLVTLGPASLVTGVASWASCLVDPPDKSFRTIAKPVVPALPISQIEGLTAKQVALVKATARSALEIAVVAEAMKKCIDRAAGAAEAGDETWERRQRGCASSYARRLAALYRAQLKQRKALVDALRTARVANTTVSRSQVTQSLKALPIKQADLKKLGITNAQLQFIAAAAARRGWPVAPGSIFDAIAGAKTLSALRSAAKAFDAIAKTYG